MSDLRTKMLEAVKAHAEGHIKKHMANVEVYLTNPTGIGEHSDLIESVEKELNMIAEYHDQLEVLEKYFS